MRRPLWSELRPLQSITRLALVLGVLASPASACFAGELAPAFQGTITSPTLCSPRGTALAPGGGLFVGSDCQALHHMEQFNAAGELVGTWAFPLLPHFEGPPNGVAVDGSGNVFVVDTSESRILKCTSSGALITSWLAPASVPVDVAVDGFGDVYVAESARGRVRKSTPSGSLIKLFGAPGSTPGSFLHPSGVAVDASGRVYGADGERGRVLRFLASGAFDMELAPPIPPTDVAVGPDGNIYVISFESNLVYMYSPDGALLGFFDSPLGLDEPYRIIIDSTGMIYITEQSTNRITKFQIVMTTPVTHLTIGRLKAMYR